jgi:glycosyltransferase involved in cell wall biosynthesis
MTFSSPLPNVHIWTPGLFDFKGGIQTYSNFFLNALKRVCPQVNIRVFSTHDRPANLAVDIAGNTSGKMKRLRHLQFYGMGNWPNRVRIPAYAVQVVLAGLLYQPDLVISTHTNFTPAARFLKKLTGIPYWTVAHGFEVWDLKQHHIQQGLKDADRILSVSHYTRQRLITEQALCPNKIVRLPNTFDLDRFTPAPKPAYLLEKYRLHKDQPICLTVNRLADGEAFHAYDQILQALPAIIQAIPNFHYMIVGKGKDRGRLEQLIQTLGLNDCVTLAGFVPDEILPDYYNLCDIFAMPSKLEGFGIVFLEAMACGKPVLGSNQDGSLDALDYGRLGALVDPDNLGEIAQSIIQIIQGFYPNPLLYKPQALRAAVTDIYGPQAFEKTIAMLLQRSPLAHRYSFSSSESAVI